jgi:alcohol dehydrogenase (cytochrome c)
VSDLLLRYTILAILSLVLVSSVSVSGAAEKDWASYNRTLTSERFAALAAINTGNVQGLKILCTYDTGEYTGFQTDLLEVDGALFLATEHDTFAIDPDTCR